MVYLQSLETKATSLVSPAGSDPRDARRLVKEAATAEAQRWAQDYWATTVAAEQDDEEGSVSTTTPGLVRLEVGSMWGAQSIHVTGALGTPHTTSALLARLSRWC
jgi:hypothetical protein